MTTVIEDGDDVAIQFEDDRRLEYSVLEWSYLNEYFAEFYAEPEEDSSEYKKLKMENDLLEEKIRQIDLSKIWCDLNER